MALASLSMLASTVRAHAPLETGDVALVGVWTDGAPLPSAFAFVALRDLHTDHTVDFTDDGWRAASGFRPGEGRVNYPIVGTVLAGTVVTMPGGAGIVVDPLGDQIFAYAGSVAPDGSLTGILLFGLAIGGPWQADATSTRTSALPPTLAGAQIALGTFHNYAYVGPTTGTRLELLTWIGNPGNWVGSNTSQPAFPAAFAVRRAPGEPCFDDVDCAVGFCAEGVCCDSTCHRGEIGHCFGCDFGPGDPRSGTCQAAPPTYLCRLSGGPCGLPTTCDGVSTTCPPRALAPAGTTCRPPTGPCDAPESCDGTSTTCPADQLRSVGTPCRAPADECDAEETCSGSSTLCPADEILAAGATCRAAVSACDVPELCDGTTTTCGPDVTLEDGTSCDNGIMCDGEETCAAGLCVAAGGIDCDDGDPCTADRCEDPSTCITSPIDACCRGDLDCDDTDPCTADRCDETHICAHDVVLACLDAGGMDGGPPADDAGDAADAGGPAVLSDCECSASRGRALAAPWLALAWLALAVMIRVGRRRRFP